MSTRWEIKTEIWNSLWQTSNSTVLSSSILNNKIESMIGKVCKWRVVNLFNEQIIYRVWELEFLKKKKSFIIVDDTVLWEDIDENSTVIKCTNTYSDTGYVLIGGDVIKYTSCTDSELDWCTWITIPHKASEKITYLYEMPTDYNKMIEWGVHKNTKWVLNEIKYSQDENMSVFYNFYTYEDNWTITTLLKIKWLLKDSIINTNYTHTIEAMTADEDNCILPWTYWVDVISKLIAWEFWVLKWMANGQIILNSWYNNLKEMYQYYTNKTTRTRQSTKPIY